MVISAISFGHQLREWRKRRGMSQLGLACDADISTRHLSFIETGRSMPSREMVLRLAERLSVTAREQNVLLVAAGYAPVFPERPLEDPQLEAARTAIEIVMNGHKPYPAFVLDRHWQMLAWNGALPGLFENVDPELLKPPANVLRLCLHPKGLAPRIANLAECADNILLRLSRRIELTADPLLMDIKVELEGYLKAAGVRPFARGDTRLDEVLTIMRIRVGEKLLSLFSTTMVFGSAVDVTLSELALECFFPADTETGAIIDQLQETSPPDPLPPG
jgi:transcriptional regulator with XRE-family HTH domain